MEVAMRNLAEQQKTLRDDINQLKAQMGQILERKMALHAHDDALLIHFFQESLTGAALRWYLGLKRERVQTWRSLAESFLDQYKYNMNTTPDCS
ncbi:hypothetical protein CR513_42872, partial [Mucuna pruriens]